MKGKTISNPHFIFYAFILIAALPTFFPNVSSSLAEEQEGIALKKFDLLWGGNCHYQIQNNTSYPITIISFRLTKDIDVIDNEYTPTLSIPPHEDRGALYGDPNIEKMCSEEGQPYLLHAVINYKVDGKIKTVKKEIKGMCKKL